MTITDVQNYGYSEQPSSLQRIGRIALIALNVGAAVAPIIGAILNPSVSIWREAVIDFCVHGVRAVAICGDLSTSVPDVIDGFRIAQLMTGYSDFPTQIAAGDLAIHTVNFISGRVL